MGIIKTIPHKNRAQEIPDLYRADHQTLIDRTPYIALVRIISLAAKEYSPFETNATVTFEVLETLKGEKIAVRTMEYEMPKNRSMGIDTAYQLEFFFALGSTYLGFSRVVNQNIYKALS